MMMISSAIQRNQIEMDPNDGNTDLEHSRMISQSKVIYFYNFYVAPSLSHILKLFLGIGYSDNSSQQTMPNNQSLKESESETDSN